MVNGIFLSLSLFSFSILFHFRFAFLLFVNFFFVLSQNFASDSLSISLFKTRNSVRRSSSKKGNLLPKQNSQSQLDTGPLAYQQQQLISNLVDYVGEQSDLTDDDSIISSTPIDRCTFADSVFKMQTSSVHSAVGGGGASSGSGEQHSTTVDLATENLPAVDTPDACDKAALR